jgi:chemotaxis protein CheX
MANGPTATIQSKLIQAFQAAIGNVLETMLGAQVQINSPYEPIDNDTSLYDVSGIIGFTGDVIGSAVVSLPRETALPMAEALCCEPTEFGSEEFIDAIGELANMIAGNAKKDFGVKAKIGIPSVVIGTNHKVVRQRGIPGIVMPCQSDMGKFAIEINIKTNANAEQEEAEHEVSTCG